MACSRTALRATADAKRYLHSVAQTDASFVISFMQSIASASAADSGPCKLAAVDPTSVDILPRLSAAAKSAKRVTLRLRLIMENKG